METDVRRRYRSLFWPVVLIGVGVIWFLHNMGIVSLSMVNLAVLVRLWPIFLIVLGLDLLLGRRSPILGGLIGLGAAAVVLALVLVGPALGLVDMSELALKTEQFSAPLDRAEAAEVSLDMPIGSIDLYALSDSDQLIEATVTHAGEIEFQTGGEREKTVILTQRYQPQTNIDVFGWFDSAEELKADIGLSPAVPLDLTVNLNVGQAQLDMSQLQLSALAVNGDVGHVDLTLPATNRPYIANLQGDVGAFEVHIPAAADIDLTIDGDVGGFTIDLPPEAGVRIEGRVEVGNIQVPARFRRVTEGDDDFIGERGRWESDNYSNADRKINITFRGEVGGLVVR